MNLLRAPILLSTFAIAATLAACAQRNAAPVVEGTVPTTEQATTTTPPVVPTTTGKGRTAKAHRATAVACNAEPVVGNVGKQAATANEAPPAQCAKDADCTAGNRGRCAMVGGGRLRPSAQCVYDACMQDADCGPRSECACGTGPAAGNRCMAGNCATDADCGEGMCSPTLGSCGNYGGYVGNYCHTAADECTNDDECTATDRGNGYCAYSKETSNWRCSYGHCVG